MVGMGFRRIALAQGLLDGSLESKLGDQDTSWPTLRQTETAPIARLGAPDHGYTATADREGRRLAR